MAICRPDRRMELDGCASGKASRLPASGVVKLSYSERVCADWRREIEIVRPPLPFARPRRTETSRLGNESISANVAQRKIDSGRHRGAIESLELVGVI